MRNEPSEKRRGALEVVEARRLRRKGVELMILQGVTDVNSMAARYAVSAGTIRKDVKWCYQQFALRDGDLRYQRKAMRVAELDNIIRLAHVAFARSQENEETETTKTEDNNDVVTRTVKGQAGDPAFLRIAQAAVVEKAKLDGLYTSKLEIANASNSPISQEDVKAKEAMLQGILEKTRSRLSSPVPSKN